MEKRFLSLDEQEQINRIHGEQDNELLYAQEEEWEQRERESEESALESGQADIRGHGVRMRKPDGEDTIMNRMAQWRYSKEQKEELHKIIALGMPAKTILAVFYPETDVRKMEEIRKTFQALRHMEN